MGGVYYYNVESKQKSSGNIDKTTIFQQCHFNVKINFWFELQLQFY